MILSAVQVQVLLSLLVLATGSFFARVWLPNRKLLPPYHQYVRNRFWWCTCWFAKQMEAATGTSCESLVAFVGLRATGLVNMRNTCFMNSALQCFFHSPVFRAYFLSNRFESEVNKKNRLSSRRAIASANVQLQSALWHEHDQGYLLPGRFQDEFTRVCSHFKETRQYIFHEFLWLRFSTVCTRI